MNPKQSAELLKELVSLGFTDRAFATLHHFRAAGRDATIKDHIRYCEEREAFQENSQNPKVHKRLEIVLGAYRGGRFQSSAEGIFLLLAQAAVREIPLPERKA